ncbi:MAG: MFS transporter, partial [Anaerolineae bacterium]|nr:MFS transporter [Anaerolineae bacterium]
MFLQRCKWQPVPRVEFASARLVWLMLAARFLDEWWGGLLVILLPLIRDDLGLDYAQVSVLLASFGWAGWFADPVTGLIADVWRRRPIIAWSALGVAGVMLVLARAASFEVMLLVCLGYSVGVTPLAVIADAVLVDTHPDAVGRIMARQTLIDTLGALLAPLTATVLAALGMPWPPAFLIAFACFVLYGALLWRTDFPPNGVNHDGEAEEGDSGGLRAMWHNLRAVSREPGVWRWLFFITAQDFITDVALGFKALFLADVIGLDAGWIGLYLAVDMAAGVAGLALLDRALGRWSELVLLRASALAVSLLFPLWLFTGAAWLNFLFSLLLTLGASALWPLAKGRLLAAADGRTATVAALSPLTGLPANVVPLIVGAVAGVAGLRAGLLILLVGPAAMLLILYGARRAEATRV